MIAVNILMKQGAESSNNPRDIIGIGISNGAAFNVYAVTDLYSYLKSNSDLKIYLANSDTFLVPTMALNGDVYIRSSFANGITDSLMKLPRI
ncbi:MAG: hypothetical protein NC120_06960 [Ruminococcus sp.]|nr:hypothetical protein [Ruminococcus sp.]